MIFIYITYLFIYLFILFYYYYYYYYLIIIRFNSKEHWTIYLFPFIISFGQTVRVPTLICKQKPMPFAGCSLFPLLRSAAAPPCADPVTSPATFNYLFCATRPRLKTAMASPGPVQITTISPLNILFTSNSITLPTLHYIHTLKFSKSKF